jgi:hypothetical protein
MQSRKPDPHTLLRIEESEVTRAEDRQFMTEKGINALKVLTLKPSPKVNLLEEKQHIIFRGRIMLIKHMHVFDDPTGDFAEIALSDYGSVV